MSDEFSMSFPNTPLQDAVKQGRKEQLEAIRDYIARELEANLCNTCRNSRLRTGDQASLILRLQSVLADIEALPKGDGEVSQLERIRLRSIGPDGISDAPDRPLSGKSAQRRSGGRRPRSNGGAVS